MTAPIDTCWSFSMTGERCAKPAGHQDEHEHVSYTRWTDEEAWTPDSVKMSWKEYSQSSARPLPPGAVPVTEQNILGIIEGTCLSCDHPSHDSECQVPVAGGRIICGCTSRV